MVLRLGSTSTMMAKIKTNAPGITSVQPGEIDFSIVASNTHTHYFAVA